MKSKDTSVVVVGGGGKPVEEAGVDDDEEQLGVVEIVCDAIDHEGGFTFLGSLFWVLLCKCWVCGAESAMVRRRCNAFFMSLEVSCSFGHRS